MTVSRRTTILGASALGAIAATGASPAHARGDQAVHAARVQFENSRGRRVVGLLRRSSGRRLIVMTPGWQNNKSSRGRFDYLGATLAQAGFSTLAIDPTGCGESDDGPITMASAQDDVRSAILWGQGKGYKEFGLYGNSWGSQVSIRAVDNNVSAIAVSGALTGPMNYNWADYYPADQLAELAATGSMTVPDPEPIWRQTQVLSQESLDDYANIDQAATLQRLTIPMLMMNGNVDWEEQALLAHSQKAVQYLPDGSRVVIFDGSPHSLQTYITLCGALLGQWFEEHLS